MRTRTKITDLSPAQWDRLQLRAQTSYDIPPGIARVCAVFELGPMTERHVEMPVQAFATLMAELAQLGHAETSLAAVSLSGLPAHLEATRNAADPVRAAERRKPQIDRDAADLLDGISEFPSMEGPTE